MPPSAPIGDKKNIVKMAYIYFQEGRWDKAIEEYKKLLTLDPEDINTHNMLGDVFVKKGAFKEAYEEYVRVVTELSNRGQNDKAAVVNKKISALDPANLPPEARSKQNLIKRTLQAEDAMEKGDYQTAIDAFGEVLKIDPDNIGIYSKLAEMLVAKGKTPEAIQQYAVMGGAYLKNRMYKKAQESFQKILELDPNQVEARINLAQIFIKQGSESDAKKEYLTVAEIYLRQGELDKAQQFAHKSVELKGIEAYFILGQTLFKKKQFSEAKIELDNLLRFKVNHVGGLTYLGLVFLELNQLDKAAEQFTKAQKIDKDNPKILEAQAELSIKKGAKAEALTLLIQVSTWYLGKKDHKKALEIARKAEALDNEAPLAVKLLGDALVEDGQRAEGERVLLRAADLFEKKGQGDLAEPIRKKAKEVAEAMATSTAPPTTPPVAEEVEKPEVAEKAEVDESIPEPEEVVAETPETEPGPSPQEPPPETAISKEEVEAPSDRVLDLEEEVVPIPEPVKLEAAKPEAVKAEPVAPPAPVVAEKPADTALDRETELKSQMEIAENYIRQNMVEDAIEIYQQLLENYPDHPEVKGKLNDAYTLYVKGGDEVIDALEAERKAKEDEEKRIREEKERRAKDDQERKAKLEAERKAKEDAERHVREEAELRAREEALQKARVETERKAKEDEERRQKEEQLQKAKVEAERLLREDLEKKVKEETERKIREELTRKVKEGEEQRLKEEQERRAKAEAESRLRDELEKRSKEEAERLLREELDRKAKEEAERKHRKEEERKEREAAEQQQRKAREEAEHHQREERERKAREDAEAARLEQERQNQVVDTPRMGAGVPDAAKSARLAANDDAHDEFMTIAVADIYVRQGLFDEAQRIYGRIVDTEPDNYEAKKKLSDLENVMRAKGLLTSNVHQQAPVTPAPVATSAPSAPEAVVAPPPTVHPTPALPIQEVIHTPVKEAVAKKKPGKVGYV